MSMYNYVCVLVCLCMCLSVYTFVCLMINYNILCVLGDFQSNAHFHDEAIIVLWYTGIIYDHVVLWTISSSSESFHNIVELLIRSIFSRIDAVYKL